MTIKLSKEWLSDVDFDRSIPSRIHVSGNWMYSHRNIEVPEGARESPEAFLEWANELWDNIVQDKGELIGLISDAYCYSDEDL